MSKRSNLVIKHLTWGMLRFEGALRAMAPGFEKEHPNIKIEIDGGRDAQALREIADRELTSKSDKYGVMQHQCQLTPTYGEPKLLLPLEDYINDPKIGIKDKEDYAKINWDMYTYRGKDGEEHLYGVPTDTNVLIMYDRKDVLEKHGFKEPPATIDECDEVIKATHDPPDLHGFICQLELGFYPAMFWINLLWNFGGDVLDRKTWEPACNSDKGLRALDLELYWHRNYGVPGEEYWTRSDLGEHLGARGTGVLDPIAGGDGLPQNPELSPYGNVLRSGRVPAGPGARYSMMYGVGCAVPAAYKHPREAFQWIEYQQRKGENVKLYCRAGGQPGRESALKDPKIQKFPHCRHFQALADTIKYDARVQWHIPEQFMIETIAGEECTAALLGKKSVHHALTDMERRLSKTMKDAGYY